MAKDPFDTPYPSVADIVNISPQTGYMKQLADAQRAAASTQRSAFTELVKALGEQKRAEVREQKAAEKALSRDPGQALDYLGVPTFDSRKPQGYDNLPYSEQKKLHAAYLEQMQNAARPALGMLGLDADKTEEALAAISERNPAPKKPTRKGFDLATDVLGGLASGVTSFGSSVASLPTLGPNAVSKTLDSASQALLSGRSDVERDTEKQRAFDEQQLEASGVTGPERWLAEAKNTLANLSVGEFSNVLGSTVVPAAATFGAGAALRGAGLTGKALERGSRIIGGISAGVGGAGDAGTTAYQAVSAMPIEDLRSSPKWTEALTQAEGDENKARDILAQGAFAVAAGTAAPTTALLATFGPSVEAAVARLVAQRSGKEALAQTAERVTLASTAKAAAGGALEEATEEGPLTQGAANLGQATATGDYSARALEKGVVSNAVLGALVGGPSVAAVEGLRAAGQGPAPTQNQTPGGLPPEGAPGPSGTPGPQVVDGVPVVYNPNAAAGKRWSTGPVPEGANPTSARIVATARNKADLPSDIPQLTSTPPDVVGRAQAALDALNASISAGTATPEEQQMKAWLDANIDSPESLAIGLGVKLEPAPAPEQIAPTPAPEQVAPTPAPEQVAPTPAPATVPEQMQPRSRERAASVAQMQSIKREPDPERLGFSRTAASGAPMIVAKRAVPEADKGRVDVVVTRNRRIPVQYAVVEADELSASHDADGNVNPNYERADLQAANNGRTAGLQAAWAAGNAGTYLQGIEADAALHGVPVEAIRSKKKPVLVRLMSPADMAKGLGAELNDNPQIEMSPVEQARADALTLPPLDELTWTEDGDLHPAANTPFFRAWFGNIGTEAAAALQDAGGRPNPAALARLRMALVQKAYGDGPLLNSLLESLSSENRNAQSALVKSAVPFASADSELGLAFRRALPTAFGILREAASRGMSVRNLLAQADIEARDPIAVKVATFLSENAGKPAQAAKGISALAQYVLDSEKQAETADIFGTQAKPTADAAFDYADKVLDSEGMSAHFNPKPAGQTSLFAPPTSREVIDDAVRRKDRELRGGDEQRRTDIHAGPGTLFAGPAPEQASIPEPTPTPVLYSKINPRPLGTTVAALRQSIRKVFGSKVLDRLEQKGILRVVQTLDEARAHAAAQRQAQGYDTDGFEAQLVQANPNAFYDNVTGTSYLIADNMVADMGAATVAHEVGVHAMGLDASVQAVFEQAQRLIEEQSPFMERVRERLKEAGETSEEEVTAYITDAYTQNVEKASPSVKQWIKDLIAAIRTWAMRTFGMRLNLTPADVAAIARDSVRRAAKNMPAPRGRMESKDVLFSRGTFAGNVSTDKQAAAATPGRAAWQAAIGKGGTRAEVLSSFKDKAVERLFDFREPFNKAIRSWATSNRVKTTILGNLDRAANRASYIGKQAYEKYGLNTVYDLLGKLARQAGVNVETAWRDVGYLLTAEQAEKRNQEMIVAAYAAEKAAQDNAQKVKAKNGPKITQYDIAYRAAVNAMQAAAIANDLAAHERAVGRMGDIAEARENLIREVTEARKAALEAQTDLSNLLQAVHDPRLDRGQPGSLHIAPIAGFNNAQAQDVIKRYHSKYDLDVLMQLREHVATLNGFRLATDLESGRSAPEVIAQFLGMPEHVKLMQDFVDEAEAFQHSGAKAAPDYERLKAEVVKALSNNYVPLTGKIDDNAEDFIPQGFVQPNLMRDVRAQGRSESLPDDGLTALLGALNKSAKTYGWRPFLNSVAGAVDNMSDSERAASGVHVERLSPNTMGIKTNAIVLRRGASHFAYIFSDENALRALRGENVLEPFTAATRPTRLFSWLATQANLAFAPRSYFGDTWERIENMRTYDITDADGAKVDANRVARSAMAKLFSPLAFTRFLRATLASVRGKHLNTYEGQMLKELEAQGALTSWSAQFSPHKATLMKQLHRHKSLTGKARKALGDFIHNWNMTFDKAQLLPVYMSLREAGVTPRQAASLTLRTMDFGKKGAWTGIAKVFYPFVQTSLTGGRNMGGILKTKRGLARLTAYSIAAIFLQSMLRASAGDDEGGNKLDQVPESVRKSHLLIPAGEGFVKIRIGYGLPRIANAIALNALGVSRNDMTLAEAAGMTLGDFTPVFSPLDAPSIDVRNKPVEAMMHMFGPAFLSGPISVATNTTRYGTRVRNDAFWDKQQFKSEQGGATIAPTYKDIAVEMRQTLGIDLAPEDVKALIQSIPLGQIGQLWQSMVDNPDLERRGKNPPNRAIAPFYATLSPNALAAQFYALRDKSDGLVKRINAGEKPDDWGEREQLLLSWRKAWDKVDNSLRAEKRRITMSGLSAAAKEARTLAYDKKRNDAIVQALVKYRIRAGLETTGLEK